jgi:hypothetical protein
MGHPPQKRSVEEQSVLAQKQVNTASKYQAESATVVDRCM